MSDCFAEFIPTFTSGLAMTKSMKQKIYIAADHGGFKLKEKLKDYLLRLGYEGMDFGALEHDKDDDYPDFVIPLAEKVGREKKALGIVLCRNGQGVCMAVNKVAGVRGVTGFSKKIIASTRRDDNANVLCLPADYISNEEAEKMVRVFMETEFDGRERYQRRINKLDEVK